MAQPRRLQEDENPGPETADSGAAVRVLAVDDQAVFLRALGDLIAASPGFELVGQATSGAEGLALAKRLEPDLVLLDVRMPGMDGVETAARMLAGDAGAAVVLISLEPLHDADSAMRSGVTAFLRKQELNAAALTSVWRKARGQRAALTRPAGARPAHGH